jgi:two-component system CheB/CheR fusion protein
LAIILIQHLDPSHESMLVDLLGGHAPLHVQQATEGMAIKPDNLYIIPPGTYLAVSNGVLHLTKPQARHGARLPFDFLLNSLAEAYGDRAVGVVLSGTGADGTLGLQAIKRHGGYVIAQDPDEAGFDGMPRSAIMTGVVDQILPAAKIPQAIIDHGNRLKDPEAGSESAPASAAYPLPEIIELLRSRTAHDFTLYKPGTLQRRIERRMAMAGIERQDARRYLNLLHDDADELELLTKDLLINVTSFFRDPAVFSFLAEKVIPELVLRQPLDQPLRIWVAGCSTGEETYSLAMLFQEEIAAQNRHLKLQLFASDVDSDAVAKARDGVYPETIETDVSPGRLARFFSKEGDAYRISSDLRALVVFTTQDVLADPPFSRLDMVSCRNLLIYLKPEAQAKVISLFHFALRQGGIMLLGSSETAGNIDGRFDVVSKTARVYRHVGRARLGEFGPLLGGKDNPQITGRSSPDPTPLRQASLADLCRRLVVETYAPAAVLINRQHECLYSLGPTDRYLRVAPGQPSHDLLVMARQGLRIKLRSAIQQAGQQSTRIVVPGGRLNDRPDQGSFSIAVQPVQHDGEDLMLICFFDDPKQPGRLDRSPEATDAPRVQELERELEATRIELEGAIHNLEISNEEQKAVNEEALSVNEEFQSTNEELLTSKEELQSLNEELTALNSQLQETLEQQRTTSNDLQNVLYSTDVATIFLDRDLNIRFFTPATKLLFNVIPSDIGRPLADLRSLAVDTTLLGDAQKVLQDLSPVQHEISTPDGAFYLRKVLPYRVKEGGVEGVVITFADVTEMRHAADAMNVAKRQAELATKAKSRFLAAASHDLRQPLQTLTLLQGLLTRTVAGDSAQKLLARIDDTLGAMSGMLNTLLDINLIEAGTVQGDLVNFPIDDMLKRLREEFSYHAQEPRLTLRVVPSSLTICSDPRLLEQMVRNLLSNALKFTRRGKVLLGCRRHSGLLSIEIWDTGIGIPEAELQTIFEEYHQLDNARHERSRGMGLGLAIVQRLGKLLNHPIGLRSQPGKGSVFAIDVPLAVNNAVTEARNLSTTRQADLTETAPRTGTILVVEDDPEVRELLYLLLKDEGHHVTTAADGVQALDILAHDSIRPDLILADYDLPNDVSGLQLVRKMREGFHQKVPVIILTGDISTETLRNIALEGCTKLNKPVKLKELQQVQQHLLPPSPPGYAAPQRPPVDAMVNPASSTVIIVDDNSDVRASIRAVLEDDGRQVEDYDSCEAFLAAYRPGRDACLLIDACLPGMQGIDLLRRLKSDGHRLPSIMITGHSDIPTAIEAMRAGASDFIEKPVGRSELLASIDRAIEQSRDAGKLQAWQQSAALQLANLTDRQRQIMDMVLAGHPSKNIAVDLGISQRTVENHRAAIMKKTGANSLPALARLALAGATREKLPPQTTTTQPD